MTGRALTQDLIKANLRLKRWTGGPPDLPDRVDGSNWLGEVRTRDWMETRPSVDRTPEIGIRVADLARHNTGTSQRPSESDTGSRTTCGHPSASAARVTQDREDGVARRLVG